VLKSLTVFFWLILVNILPHWPFKNYYDSIVGEYLLSIISKNPLITFSKCFMRFQLSLHTDIYTMDTQCPQWVFFLRNFVLFRLNMNFLISENYTIWHFLTFALKSRWHKQRNTSKTCKDENPFQDIFRLISSWNSSAWQFTKINDKLFMELADFGIKLVHSILGKYSCNSKYGL
jgi:hypothetical protein